MRDLKICVNICPDFHNCLKKSKKWIKTLWSRTMTRSEIWRFFVWNAPRKRRNSSVLLKDMPSLYKSYQKIQRLSWKIRDFWRFFIRKRISTNWAICIYLLQFVKDISSYGSCDMRAFFFLRTLEEWVRLFSIHWLLTSTEGFTKSDQKVYVSSKDN